jgi:hypothetical protein
MKDKLQKIALALESTKGELKLLACVWRDDVKKWDILVSANWINYSKLQEDIGVIFDEFKKEFNGEFALRFSGIFPLSTTEPFVNQITQLISVTSGTVELKEIRIGEVKVDKIALIVSRPVVA